MKGASRQSERHGGAKYEQVAGGDCRYGGRVVASSRKSATKISCGGRRCGQRQANKATAAWIFRVPILQRCGAATRLAGLTRNGPGPGPDSWHTPPPRYLSVPGRHPTSRMRDDDPATTCIEIDQCQLAETFEFVFRSNWLFLESDDCYSYYAGSSRVYLSALPTVEQHQEVDGNRIQKPQ